MLTSAESVEPLRLKLRAQFPTLAREYRVKTLGLFGAYVRQEQTPDSDLDVLMEFDEPPSLFGFIRLESQLSELVGINVDLVMKDALKPVIGRRILEELEPL